MPPSIWPTRPYFIWDNIISGAAQRVVNHNQLILISRGGRLRGDGVPTAYHVSGVEKTTFFFWVF